ncbi:hypothetical protein KC320_g24 [Hortaea werneckii]|nr:hypothetical protein KC320_g24 [Hortaea werneckii]
MHLDARVLAMPAVEAANLFCSLSCNAGRRRRHWSRHGHSACPQCLRPERSPRAMPRASTRQDVGYGRRGASKGNNEGDIQR